MSIDKKKIIADHFNKMPFKGPKENSLSDQADSYGSNSVSFLLRQPYQYIETIIKNSSISNATCLDYCCGTGQFSVFPILSGYKVIGIDISEKSIKLAEERSIELSINHKCHFQSMDAENLSFEDDSFDLILSYNSLTYLDLNKSYSELSRVLRNDGKLIIMDSLGHNILFNLNRMRNLNIWGPSIKSELKLLKKRDIYLGKKYFQLDSIKYFGFTTPFFHFTSKRLGLNLNKGFIKFLNIIDHFILSLPLAHFFAFKYVAIYKLKKIKNKK